MQSKEAMEPKMNNNFIASNAYRERMLVFHINWLYYSLDVSTFRKFQFPNPRANLQYESQKEIIFPSAHLNFIFLVSLWVVTRDGRRYNPGTIRVWWVGGNIITLLQCITRILFLRFE